MAVGSPLKNTSSMADFLEAYEAARRDFCFSKPWRRVGSYSEGR